MGAWRMGSHGGFDFSLVNDSHGDGWLLSCKDRVVGKHTRSEWPN